MFSRTMSVLLFSVLGCFLLLGDEKQSLVLVTSTAGTIGLFAYDWYLGKRTYDINKTVLIAWHFVFISLMVASPFARSVGYAVWDSIRYMNAFLLYTYFSNRKEHELQSRFLKELSTWTVVVLFMSYAIEYIPSLQSMIPKMNLLYKSYGHNHVVNILILILPYLVWNSLRSKSLAAALTLLFVLMGIITSYARGVVLLLVSTLVPLSMSLKARRTKIEKSHLFTIFTVTLIGTGVLLLTLFIFNQTHPGATRPFLPKTSIFESRMEYWKQSMLAIRDRPLFGNGPGSFYLVSKKYQADQNRYSWYAHSYPIQTAVELGLFGFMCVATLFVVTVVHGIRLNRETNSVKSSGVTRPLLVGALLSLMYSVIEMNLDFTVVWLLLWIFLGLLHQTQGREDTKKQGNQQISVVAPLLFLFVFYCCAVTATAFQLRPGGVKTAVWLMSHDAGLAERYLEYISTEKSSPRHSIDMIYLFHEHNPDVLSKIAATQSSEKDYDYYMYNAIQNDPKNRSLIESYIADPRKQNDSDRFFRVAQILIMNISVDKKSDIKFIQNNWSNIRECFNEKTMLWVDPPYTDTYEAKTLYFAALCLIKAKEIQNAASLLKIAVNSQPSWSNIYIDYASVVWWNDSDKQQAATIIQKCKKNKNAKAHCTEFDRNTFLDISVYDATVRLKE